MLHEGRYYDSKAIAGVAYGYEQPERGPLAAAQFSGGEATFRRQRMPLGFLVVKLGRRPAPDAPAALLLVENEVTIGDEYDFSADATGFSYHFPNQYRNRAQPGTPFAYCRVDGSRGHAEYFGRCVISAVWQDPEQPDGTPAKSRPRAGHGSVAEPRRATGHSLDLHELQAVDEIAGAPPGSTWRRLREEPDAVRRIDIALAAGAVPGSEARQHLRRAGPRGRPLT